jgi:selenocysteine lyase/cysteine desulfurase
MEVSRRHFFKRGLQGAALAWITPWNRLLAETVGWAARPSLATLAATNKNDERFWRLVRESFPLTHDRIYFNNGGLGPSPFVVLDAVHETTLELEEISETGHHRFDEARQRVAAFVGADPTEIAFTRNATEGMNIIARGLPLKPGDEILMTTHEHPGGAMPWLGRAKDDGLRVRLFEPGKDAAENLERIERELTPRTRVLAISHITMTLGQVMPIKQICALARSKGVFTAIDGAQVLGMVPVDLHDLGCDFYTSSGHKWLLGPKGTGVVYISKRMAKIFRPTFVGAYSNTVYDLDRLVLEYRQDAVSTEYGTRNVALPVGLATAVEFLETITMERVAAHGRKLAGRLKAGVAELPRVELLTPTDDADSASIVTFRVKNSEHTEIVGRLGKEFRMRVRPVGEHGLNAIRISLHVYNNEEEVDQLLAALKEITRES